MKYIKYIVYAVVLLLLIFNLKQTFFNAKTSVLRIDTVEVVKIIPSITKTVVKDSLIPIYVDNNIKYKKLFKDLAIKYGKKADSVTILRELLQSKTKRKYKEVFKDSILDAEITAVTTGTLDSLTFKYTKHRQEIRYNEITKYVTPKYRVLAGFTLSESSYANIGVQTRKGHVYSIGLNDKGMILDFKFSLFEKY